MLIKSYNARYIIGEHFDCLINEIDMRAEIILAKTTDQNEIDLVNNLREELINKIQMLKEDCLSDNVDIQNAFEDAWNVLIDDQSIAYEIKLDIFKKNLIKRDCIIVNDPKFKIGCSIWITDWYNDKKQIDFLRFKIM